MEELGETDNSVSLNHIVSYFPNKFCDNITILSYGFRNPRLMMLQFKFHPVLFRYKSRVTPYSIVLVRYVVHNNGQLFVFIIQVFRL